MKDLCLPCPEPVEVVLTAPLPDTLCPCPEPIEPPRLLDIIRTDTEVIDTFPDALRLVLTTYNCPTQPNRLSYRPPMVEGIPPRGAFDTFYSFKFIVRNGEPPYTWSIASELPLGLTFDQFDGIIEGVPLETGRFYFTVKVTDDKKRSNSLMGTIDIQG